MQKVVLSRLCDLGFFICDHIKWLKMIDMSLYQRDALIEKIYRLQYGKISFWLVRIKRILHSWSFHMKVMKLAFGDFHKFHMK